MAKRIKSFGDLHAWVETHRKKPVIYKGVTKSSYELLPTIGRCGLDAAKVGKEEQTMLRLFRQQAPPHLHFVPANTWEWLAIAQDHGLPTRLLDWTRNPLVAAYFAVEKQHDGDSAIYAYTSKTHISIEKYPDPFLRKKVGKFVPNHVTARITAQVGLFTIHPEPSVPFVSPDVEQVLIDRDYREELKKTLDTYGIHRVSLFPDLDGLAIHIKWQRTPVYRPVPCRGHDMAPNSTPRPL